MAWHGCTSGLRLSAKSPGLYLIAMAMELTHAIPHSPLHSQVADFNMAKLVMPSRAVPSSSTISVTNPRWLAPEVLAGGAHTFASVRGRREWGAAQGEVGEGSAARLRSARERSSPYTSTTTRDAHSFPGRCCSIKSGMKEHGWACARPAVPSQAPLGCSSCTL